MKAINLKISHISKNAFVAHPLTFRYSYAVEQINILETVNIHILKVWKFGRDSATASLQYRRPKSRWVELPSSLSMKG